MSESVAVVLDVDSRGVHKLTRFVLEAVSFYISAIGLAARTMDLAVIAAFPQKSEYLLSGDWTQISTLVLKGEEAMKLLHANRQDSELETPIAQAVSKALCFVRKRNPTGGGRVILFEHSLDPTEFSSQSVSLSNCAWAANQIAARIHLVSLGTHSPSASLVSLCHKTGGTHIVFSHTQTLGELVQALLFHLTARESVASLLKVRPAPSTQHMGAVCACHNKLLDKGYVCSICLSIYCAETAGTCAVCGSRIRREAKDDQAISAQLFSKLFHQPQTSSIFLT
jgi:hypothetical protein